jgi:uncharacterized membrane protein YdbT with pleckstrin-like domain
MLAAIWGVFALLLIYSFCAAVMWYSMFFTVTSKRLITVRGAKVRKVFTLPLTAIESLTFKRSPLGRILGYGTFIIMSSGQDKARSKVKYLPYPEQLYLEVCGLLLRLGRDSRQA